MMTPSGPEEMHLLEAKSMQWICIENNWENGRISTSHSKAHVFTL